MGISLLNYGIGLDWKDGKRPDYMRTGEFVSSDCDKCYFCINGHTNGIAHAGKKKGVGPPVLLRCKCNKRMRVDKCADVKERVGIQKGSDYCKMCYRQQGKVGTRAEKRKKCIRVD